MRGNTIKRTEGCLSAYAQQIGERATGLLLPTFITRGFSSAKTADRMAPNQPGHMVRIEETGSNLIKTTFFKYTRAHKQ